MRESFLGFAGACAAALVAVMLAAAAIVAKASDDHAAMSHAMTDSRIAVVLPAPMRVHMLANMRSHQQALADILAALAKGDGPGAAQIAETRLGLGAPHAAACKPGAATGAFGDMAAMMASKMPEDMRALGLAMHSQASKFAEEAAKGAQGGDPRPTLAELSQVVQACNACHAAFRLD